MIIFSVIFGRLAALPSEGIPYPVFTYTALLPWQLFTFALTQSSNSLVVSQNLVSKVVFPRLVIPIASVGPGLVDYDADVRLSSLQNYRLSFASFAQIFSPHIVPTLAPAASAGVSFGRARGERRVVPVFSLRTLRSLR